MLTPGMFQDMMEVITQREEVRSGNEDDWN